MCMRWSQLSGLASDPASAGSVTSGLLLKQPTCGCDCRCWPADLKLDCTELASAESESPTSWNHCKLDLPDISLLSAYETATNTL